MGTSSEPENTEVVSYVRPGLAAAAVVVAAAAVAVAAVVGIVGLEGRGDVGMKNWEEAWSQELCSSRME